MIKEISKDLRFILYQKVNVQSDNICRTQNENERGDKIPTVRGNWWKYPFAEQSKEKERDNGHGRRLKWQSPLLKYSWSSFALP